jgi:hypothetical protein
MLTFKSMEMHSEEALNYATMLLQNRIYET